MFSDSNSSILGPYSHHVLEGFTTFLLIEVELIHMQNFLQQGDTRGGGDTHTGIVLSPTTVQEDLSCKQTCSAAVFVIGLTLKPPRAA